MTEQEFIVKMGECAVKDQEASGILASVTIAQAILESGYGTTELAVNANNFFGMKTNLSGNKWDSVWDKVSKYTKQTKEQKTDGTEYTIVADFRKYPSMEMSVRDHSCYLLGAMKDSTHKRYAGLQGEKDPKKAIQIIKDGGYATDVKYVQRILSIIQRFNLTKYDNQGGNVMSNSSLVTCTVKSPNHSGKRTHSVDRITPHCVVGQLSASGIGGCFTSTSRQASCNYGIGTEGGVCLIVDEANRSWCSSSNANDQRAITIECASDKTAPYAFNSTVYNKLVDLCVDICKRYGKKKLLWISDKNTALNYNPNSDEMLLTVHRWFANKSCPGDWMYSRMGDLASKVTARLGGSTQTEPTQPSGKTTSFPATHFSAQVVIDDLNIRTAPNMGGAVVGQTGKGVFTITEVKDGWGKLKSGAGWIYLKNKSYVTIGSTIKSNNSTPQSGSKFPYLVKVTADVLNVRAGAGVGHKINTSIKQNEVYTIVAEQSGWGKLKSGAGWINLYYTKRV